MSDCPLTVTEFAARVGRAACTVRKWCADGHVRASQPGPNCQWLIQRSELRRLLGEDERRSEVDRIRGAMAARRAEAEAHLVNLEKINPAAAAEARRKLDAIVEGATEP